MACARQWPHGLLNGAPLFVQTSKEAALLGMAMPIERAIDAVFPNAWHMLEVEDLIEGPQAFADKHAPVRIAH